MRPDAHKAPGSAGLLQAEGMTKQMASESQHFVLRATNLTKSFDGHQVLDRLSAVLFPGEVVVLRGDNGSGKTTLLNVLSGFITPDSGVLEIRGEQDLLRADFDARAWPLLGHRRFSPEKVARLGCGRTWQDIRLFQTQTVEANVAVAGKTADRSGLEWLLRQRRGAQAERSNLEKVADLLGRVGLAELAVRRADTLSLGLSKKVAIVRAVHGGGGILFLDEPISGLDDRGSRLVLKLLRELAGRPKLTLVIVEHTLNLACLLDFSTTVWTLERGQILQSEPAGLQAKQAQMRGGEPGLPAILADLSEVSRTDFPGGGVLSVRRVHESNRRTPVLEVKRLEVRRGPHFVLSGNEAGIELALRAGEIGLLFGPNGWGKTTLLDSIAGLVQASSGIIRLDGRDIQAMPIWLRAQYGVCYLRAREFLFPRLSMEEQLQIAQVHEAGHLASSLRGRRVANLSGGERRRIGLQATLARTPSSIILLDEPFSALDDEGLELLLRSLVDAARDRAILIAIPGSVTSADA